MTRTRTKRTQGTHLKPIIPRNFSRLLKRPLKIHLVQLVNTILVDLRALLILHFPKLFALLSNPRSKTTVSMCSWDIAVSTAAIRVQCIGVRKCRPCLDRTCQDGKTASLLLLDELQHCSQHGWEGRLMQKTNMKFITHKDKLQFVFPQQQSTGNHNITHSRSVYLLSQVA